jgi:hypothetical protein
VAEDYRLIFNLADLAYISSQLVQIAFKLYRNSLKKFEIVGFVDQDLKVTDQHQI